MPTCDSIMDEVLDERRAPADAARKKADQKLYDLPARKLGRLTPRVHDIVVSAVRKGAYWSVAAGAAGISQATIYAWISRGKLEKAAGSKSRYTRLLDALARAQDELEAELAAKLSSGGDGKYPDWRAQAFVLERRFKDRWGPPKEERNQGVTLTLTSEQLEALADSMRVAGAKDITPSQT